MRDGSDTGNGAAGVSDLLKILKDSGEATRDYPDVRKRIVTL